MSTLSETVQNTRKFIIGFIIFSIIVIIAQFISVELSKNTKKYSLSPTYYLAVTKDSSTYTRYNLTSLEIGGSSIEFVKVGDFPSFPPVINVYKIKEKNVNLSSIEKARQIANILKLNPNYERIDDNRYIWKSDKTDLTLEFDRRNYQIKVRKDLFNAVRNPLRSDIGTTNLVNQARNIIGNLGINIADVPVTGVASRVDYLLLNPDGSLQSTEDDTGAPLVRITLYKILESATLQDQYKYQYQNQLNTQTKGSVTIPPPGSSEVVRPDILEGAITIILNGKANNLDDLVRLDYIPYEYFEKFDVYSVITMDKAYETLKVGGVGSSLVYLKKEGVDIFSAYEKLIVKKFSIDAAKTKIVYVEPASWEHLDPNSEWDGHLYPYYWFEGVAILDNSDKASFVFLVDAIP